MVNMDRIRPFRGISLRPRSHAKNRPTTVPNSVTSRAILMVFHMAVTLAGSMMISVKRLVSNLPSKKKVLYTIITMGMTTTTIRITKDRMVSTLSRLNFFPSMRAMSRFTRYLLPIMPVPPPHRI